MKKQLKSARVGWSFDNNDYLENLLSLIQHLLEEEKAGDIKNVIFMEESYGRYCFLADRLETDKEEKEREERESLQKTADEAEYMRLKNKLGR